MMTVVSSANALRSCVLGILVGSALVVRPNRASAQTTVTASSSQCLPREIGVPPPVTELPRVLSLDDALRLLHTRGLDLLIADASVRTAEGVLRAAAFIYNPQVAPYVGSVFNYNPASTQTNPCVGCSNLAVGVAISDQAAIEDILSGKRGLRVRVARAALEAARMYRADAERQLVFQVRTLYVAAVAARWSLDFARETQAALHEQVELTRRRYPGLTNAGDLARMEVQGLEADQAVDQAIAGYRSAQVTLAFLLGVRGTSVPDFDVDHGSLQYRLPQQLAAATPQSLLPIALRHRPDLRAAAFMHDSAVASVSLARRLVFPDIALSAQYYGTGYGQNAIQPPTVTIGLAVSLPIFYQQQGEIIQAEANRDTQALTYARVSEQVTSDVESVFAGYVSARHRVERMESSLLAQARRARDITQAQFQGGLGTLMDLLDAERTWIATNNEYISDLAAYWTAVHQLEEAVGIDFSR